MNQHTDTVKHFQLGQKAYKEGKYDEAITQFQKSIDIDSNNADTYYWLGLVYYEWGKQDSDSGKYDQADSEYEEADKNFAQSIDLNFSDRANAYYWWGNALYSLQKSEEAADKFEKSINLNFSDQADAYYRLGNF